MANNPEEYFAACYKVGKPANYIKTAPWQDIDNFLEQWRKRSALEPSKLLYYSQAMDVFLSLRIWILKYEASALTPALLSTLLGTAMNLLIPANVVSVLGELKNLGVYMQPLISSYFANRDYEATFTTFLEMGDELRASCDGKRDAKCNLKGQIKCTSCKNECMKANTSPCNNCFDKCIMDCQRNSCQCKEAYKYLELGDTAQVGALDKAMIEIKATCREKARIILKSVIAKRRGTCYQSCEKSCEKNLVTACKDICKSRSNTNLQNEIRKVNTGCNCNVKRCSVVPICKKRCEKENCSSRLSQNQLTWLDRQAKRVCAIECGDLCPDVQVLIRGVSGKLWCEDKCYNDVIQMTRRDINNGYWRKCERSNIPADMCSYQTNLS